jgi:hypothetical protein
MVVASDPDGEGQRDSKKGSCAWTKPAEIMVVASNPDGELEL